MEQIYLVTFKKSFLKIYATIQRRAMTDWLSRMLDNQSVSHIANLNALALWFYSYDLLAYADAGQMCTDCGSR